MSNHLRNNTAAGSPVLHLEQTQTQQGLSPEEITTVKESAAKIRVEKDVTEERLHPLLQKRNALTYGRLFLERSASSFEVSTRLATAALLNAICHAERRPDKEKSRLEPSSLPPLSLLYPASELLPEKRTESSTTLLLSSSSHPHPGLTFPILACPDSRSSTSLGSARRLL